MATRWLTPVEAAARLGVSESTVWRMLRRGALPSVKLGGRRRIASSTLTQALRPLGNVTSAERIPPLTLDDPLFTLAGRFHSDGRRPGSSDKHAYLGVKR